MVQPGQWANTINIMYNGANVMRNNDFGQLMMCVQRGVVKSTVATLDRFNNVEIVLFIDLL